MLGWQVKTWLKIISAVLIIAFFTYDIAWAADFSSASQKKQYESVASRGIAYLKLAKQYAITGEYKKAIENFIMALVELKEALMLNPNNAIAKKNMGVYYCELARYYETMGERIEAIENFENAIRAFEENIKDNPDPAEARFYFGDIQAELGEYFKKIGRREDFLEMLKRAISAFKEALSINLKYGDAYYKLGIVYYSLGRYQEAVGVFNKAIEYGNSFGPEAQAYLSRALGKVETATIQSSAVFYLTEHTKPLPEEYLLKPYEGAMEAESNTSVNTILDYCDDNRTLIFGHGCEVRIANNIGQTGSSVEDIIEILEKEFTEEDMEQLSKDEPLRIVAADKLPVAALGGDCVSDKLVLLSKGLSKIKDEKAKHIMAQAMLRHEIRRHELTGKGNEAHTSENDKYDIDYLIAISKENSFERLQDFINAIEPTLSGTELYGMLQARLQLEVAQTTIAAEAPTIAEAVIVATEAPIVKQPAAPVAEVLVPEPAAPAAEVAIETLAPEPAAPARNTVTPKALLNMIANKTLENASTIIEDMEPSIKSELDGLLEQANPDPFFLMDIYSKEDLLDYFKNGKLAEEGLRLVKLAFSQIDISEASELSHIIDERISSTEIALMPLLRKIPRTIFLRGGSSINRITMDGAEFRYKSQVEFVPFAVSVRSIMAELILDRERDYAQIYFKDAISELLVKIMENNKALSRHSIQRIKDISKEEDLNIFESINKDGEMDDYTGFACIILSMLPKFPKIFLAKLPRDQWSFTFSIENGVQGVRFFNHVTGENEFVNFTSWDTLKGLLSREQYNKIMGLFIVLANIPGARLVNEFDRAILDNGSMLTQFDKVRRAFITTGDRHVPLLYDSFSIYLYVANDIVKHYESVITRKFSLAELDLILSLLGILPSALSSGTRYFTFRPVYKMGHTPRFMDMRQENWKSLLIPNHFELEKEAKIKIRGSIYEDAKSFEVRKYLDELNLTLDQFIVLLWCRSFLHEQGRSFWYEKLTPELREEFISLSWRKDGKNILAKARRYPKSYFILKFGEEKEEKFDSSEDFAEHFMAYVLFGPQFKKEAQVRANSAVSKKYEFFRTHVFGGVEYDRNTDIRSLEKVYTSTQYAPQPSRIAYFSKLFDILDKIKCGEYSDINALRIDLKQADAILTIE
ncbi:MAG: hypothetical protein A2047_00760 [Omnitrophica bacterium GWA2_41_15]|nr:MAG: hypothetical protein A2047_00760 [Omnitrophica bacterium GWA2_41_15]HAZ11124.1 hypothetical protein [Candidatus Omnitrophota bacterium]